MSLEDIRGKKHSKGIYIIIGLLLIGMAGFGTNQFGLSGGSAQKALFAIGDSEVSVREYENMLNYIQQTNPKLDIKQAQQLAIVRLKDRIALKDYINRYAFTVSNEKIDENIINDLNFFENGKFSEAVFRKVIPVKPDIYRRSIANTLSLQDFQTTIINTSVISKAELQPYLDMQNIELDISVAKISRNKFSAIVNEKEIVEYYNLNKNKFITKEKYNIDYIDFNPDDVIESIIIPDSEILKKFMASRQTRQTNYYLFKDKNAAIEIADRITAGEKMADILPSLKNDIEDRGSLGDLKAKAPKDSLISQSAIDAIFALDKSGDVTAPITLDGSVYLFELVSKNTNNKINEADKDDFKKTLQRQRANNKINAINEKLNKAVFEDISPNLESISKITNLPIKNSGLISANNKQSILAVPNLLSAIEKGDKTIGKLQEPVNIDGRIIIYRLLEVEKPRHKTLKETKGQINKLVIESKLQKKMNIAAEKLIAEVKKQGLKSAANKNGYPVQTYTKFNGKVSEKSLLDLHAASIIYQQPPKLGKDKVSKIQSSTGDIYIYVTDKISINKKNNNNIHNQVIDLIKNKIGNDELRTFLSSITKRSKIIDNSNSIRK